MGKWAKWNLKVIAKELVVGSIMLLILSNIISYLRSPTLNSNDLPNVEVRLLDGTKFVYKKDKPLVIHFWATWCHTCKIEASNIQTVSKTYEVLSVAVNSGSDAKLQTYMSEKGLSFNVLNDSKGSWASDFKIEAYPTTFIYDGKGELKFAEVGYTTTAGLLARLKLIE